ncbi:PAS domain S-box [Halobacteroides halobius DSM 5150]|uniref:histidine kinase n=1 Tax=Halobacteroides halobius (strain ATCC 35273 / DSM 5150 / MD-1) TaxID=748449 RepID=L0K6P4_HALHC|nr:ATP-binding protein [Halobacteroides halobius]AGB40937.1 PAS domain S-box [Halobacteroides halobius DSM 5150]
MRDILEFIVDKHPGFVIIADDTGKIVKTNGQWGLIDEKLGQLIEKNIREIKFLKKISILETLTVGEVTYGYQIYREQGVIYYNLPTIIDAQTKGVITVGLVMDRKLTGVSDLSAFLKESSLMNTHQVGIILSDANDIVQYINQALLKDNGLQLEDVVGRSVDSFLKSSVDKSNDLRTIERQVKEENKFIHARKFITIQKTEESKIIDIISFPLELADKLIGALTFVIDIEEITRYSNKLRQAQRIEKVREMAFRIIHEIRNPLQEIMAASEIGRLKSQTDDTSFYFEEISSKIRKIDNLLNDNFQLFDGERIKPTKLYVNELLAEITGLIQEECQQKGIELLVEAKNNKTKIMADKKIIIQALLNIIENAIEFLEGHNGIKEIKIKSWVEGTNILFSIYNSGPPIEEEIRDNLFDVFSSSKGRNGAGLGLTITYYIITKLYKGEVWFESDKQGTTFYIKLENAVDKLTSNLDTSYKAITS